jgi:RNA polymerase sigma factor (sigma-70 family)
MEVSEVNWEEMAGLAKKLARILAVPPVDREDLAQSGLLGLIESLGDYKELGFTTWASRVMRSSMVDEMRAQIGKGGGIRDTSRPICDDRCLLSKQDDLAPNPIDLLFLQQVLSSDSLTIREREALVLRFVRGLTYQEAGDVLGISKQCMRQRVVSGISKISGMGGDRE